MFALKNLYVILIQQNYLHQLEIDIRHVIIHFLLFVVQKTLMKTLTKDMYLKFTLSIPENYTSYTVIFHHLKE